MYCPLENIDVYYEDVGEGKPIIMLHGNKIDHRMMMGCMEPVFFNKKGYRRIYIDLPGMGRTKGESWIVNADLMLKVLLDFIDKLIPGQKFLVSGYSYGGYLARGILSKRKELVDGLMLLCPVIIPDNAKRELPETKVILKDTEFLESLRPEELKYFHTVVQTKDTWNRLENEVIPSFKLFDRVFVRDFKEKGYEFSFEVDSREESYDIPTAIITGRFDNIVGYADAWRLLDIYPRATFAVLDMGGHNLQIEQPDLFSAIVSNWIGRIV